MNCFPSGSIIIRKHPYNVNSPYLKRKNINDPLVLKNTLIKFPKTGKRMIINNEERNEEEYEIEEVKVEEVRVPEWVTLWSIKMKKKIAKRVEYFIRFHLKDRIEIVEIRYNGIIGGNIIYRPESFPKLCIKEIVHIETEFEMKENPDLRYTHAEVKSDIEFCWLI